MQRRHRLLPVITALTATLISLLPPCAFAETAEPSRSYLLKPVSYAVLIDGQVYSDPYLPVLTLELNGGNNTYVPLRRFAQF